MTIGIWDPTLFAAYRAAPDGPRKRAMENRLYLENEPLVKTLVAQMLGTGKPGRHIPAALRRIHRAEVVESWEDAMGVAGVAFAKFLRDYDPASGKISFFLGMKIRYELQCIIERSTNIKVPRDYEAESLPQGYERYETEADMERAAHSSGLEMAPDRELELMAEARQLEADEAAPPVVVPRPASALVDFLTRRCTFGRAMTVARAALVDAYERHAFALHFAASPKQLVVALEARKVRVVTVRAGRWREPVRGFRGVALQRAV